MYKKYQDKFDYSYTLGYATTLDLLKHKPESVLRVAAKSGNTHNETLREIQSLCNQHQVEFLISDNQIERLSIKENCYVVGFFKKYSEELLSNQNHIMLVNPSDMGNMGTIIRTMRGFDHNNLAIIEPGCDSWSPKVIRGSMGARFQVKIEYFNSLQDYTSRFPAHHLYPFMLNAKHDLRTFKPSNNYTLIFGNEGSGLPLEYDQIGDGVRIHHSDNIDSLNLGISVSLALYQVTK